jgi:hypothetical protein
MDTTIIEQFTNQKIKPFSSVFCYFLLISVYFRLELRQIIDCILLNLLKGLSIVCPLAKTRLRILLLILFFPFPCEIVFSGRFTRQKKRAQAIPVL